MKASKIIPISLATIFILTPMLSFGQLKEEKLKLAYRHKSVPELKQFFESWRHDIPAISNKNLSTLNDTLQQAYNIFNAFYRPLDIEKLGGSEWGTAIYRQVSYLIVQNSVKIYTAGKIYYYDNEIDSIAVKSINEGNIADSNKRKFLKRINGKLSPRVLEIFGPNNEFHQLKDSLIAELKNFRPVINSGAKKVVYLTPEYDKALNAFLGDTHLVLGSGGIMNPARSKGESAKRQKFLERFIKIWYGHWGGYWQLFSYPVANAIIIDKQMKHAIVQFQMIYEGGEAVLENDNGHWKLLSAKRTWIE